MIQKAGLYIHIPFCSSRCGYCTFPMTVKGSRDEKMQLEYIKCLKLELRKRRERLVENHSFETLYIGGGTPSMLCDRALNLLFEMLNEELNPSFREVTFELNPEDLELRPELPAQLESLGVTRLSIGVQTMSQKGLEVLDRKTNTVKIMSLLKDTSKMFSGSISTDLILAWPGQSMSDFVNDDLPFLREAPIDHLSIYFLSIDKGTKIYSRFDRGEFEKIGDDLGRDLWDTLLKNMSDKGLAHYEISNFAKLGAESLHNTMTWDGFPYLGLGCGAVSRVGKVRWTNSPLRPRYMKETLRGGHSVHEAEFLSPEIKMSEELMLSLRHRGGLDMEGFEERHGVNPLKALGKKKEAWLKAGFIRVDEVKDRGKVLTFSENGWALYDSLVSDWMLELDKVWSRAMATKI